jgi:Na+/H+ antiporter NhaD/arsenite permease-like protein
MHLYMINLFCLATAHYLFADYILYKNPQLSTHGNAEEKKYLTIQSKFLAIMIGCSLVVVLTVFFMFDVESPYVIASYQVITVFALIMSWRIKKYKPKKKKNVIIAQ